MLPRLLIVTAVAAERDAVLAGIGDQHVLPDPLAPNAFPADPSLFPTDGARRGQILTVSTATGTRATADELAGRFPEALAEGMEGFGVATAARALGLPFAEVRAISNLVRPRDRSA